MTLRAIHRTSYEYPLPASESHNEVRLMPLTDDSQRLIDFRLDVWPATNVFSYEDVGGTVHHFGIREPHCSLEIVATSVVETTRIDPFKGLNLLEPDWGFYARESVHQGNIEFLGPSPYVSLVPEAARIASEIRREGGSAAAFLINLNHRLHDILTYDADVTHVHSTVEDVLASRAGVCQDYAHVMIACCRTQGIPTRYVSGYLFGGDGLRGDQATHAWLECLLPNGRWLALDPTNDLLANDHHIRMHVGRDYSEVTPTRGVYVGVAASRLEVGVSVKTAEAIAA